MHPSTVRLPCQPNTTLLLLRGCRAPSLDYTSQNSAFLPIATLLYAALRLRSYCNTAVRSFEVAIVHPTLLLRASVRRLQWVLCEHVLPTHHAFCCCCELYSSSCCLCCRSCLATAMGVCYASAMFYAEISPFFVTWAAEINPLLTIRPCYGYALHTPPCIFVRYFRALHKNYW